ncbi:MAG: hypothetical protein IJZ21_04570, partial [Clostridia bacterium]|nr:hypothetical protein [Clostridia bacterium]
SVPSYSIPDNIDKPDEVINTFGNNPNNVMRPFSGGMCGVVASQGDWIYYVQQIGRIIKVKTDGTDAQGVFESSGFSYIECLNVIGDIIYYINGGIWSIKTDGTARKQHTTKRARNLLVRGTTGWFAVLDNSDSTIATSPRSNNYDLYQIDLLTGETDLLAQNASGYGLKTVIDDDLIYVDGNTVYKRSLSTGSQSVLVNFDSEGYIDGIENMLVYKSSLYFDFYGNRSGYYTAKFDLDSNNKEVHEEKFRDVLNVFDYNGPVFFAQECVSPWPYSFFDANATALCPENENLYIQYGIYTFDDGYAYYFEENLISLYRVRPDGTDIKTY